MHGFGAKCGCRVPHQGHVIAEFCAAAAGGSLDAGIGQHPYHDDLFDAALLELESATGIDGVPTRKLRFAGDSPLEEARFEPSVPLWLGAFIWSKTSMSGPVGVGGFEEGEFEGDGPLEKVAAQILLRGADAVQLRAQEIDEAAKPRIVVQRDPLGMHEIDWQR